MTTEIDDKLLAKIRALLETRGCTEAEAQARVAKAQELLERHGLELASLDRSPTKRSDEKRVGGLYTWQRNLWDGVARLNFCRYFFYRGLSKGSKYEHRLIGSHANVISTEIMATYLQEVIEEHAAQWAKQRGYHSRFVREAIAFRDGMAARIVERLAVRREQQVTQARQAAEAERAARQQADFADAQTARALTILDVISSEEDFNNDYLNHWEMGTTARKRAEQEARTKAYWAKVEAERKARDEAEAANPALREARLKREAEALEKYLKDADKEQKRRNKTPPQPRPRAQTAEEKRRNMGSYWTGYDTGNKVGIDKQADDRTQKERLT